MAGEGGGGSCFWQPCRPCNAPPYCHIPVVPPAGQRFCARDNGREVTRRAICAARGGGRREGGDARRVAGGDGPEVTLGACRGATVGKGRAARVGGRRAERDPRPAAGGARRVVTHGSSFLQTTGACRAADFGARRSFGGRGGRSGWRLGRWRLGRRWLPHLSYLRLPSRCRRFPFTPAPPRRGPSLVCSLPDMTRSAHCR